MSVGSEFQGHHANQACCKSGAMPQNTQQLPKLSSDTSYLIMFRSDVCGVMSCGEDIA
jgi:hypothetical protein